ncbi:MAG: hypothetical protein GY842_21035, partial [bacterium]|nr:hypothetical protein [bacterium]
LALVVPAGSANWAEQAFTVLLEPTASYEAIRTASQTIAEACPDDDDRCITRLMAIWSADVEAQGEGCLEALRLACSKAGNATQPIILDGVRLLFRRPDPAAQERGRMFFGQPMQILASKVADPEPLLKLAVETGLWNTIVNLSIPQDLMDRYLIEGLRGCERLLSGPRLVSLGCRVSDAAIPQLRRVMRELRTASPQAQGFDIALMTLVQAEDAEVVSDLESMVTDPALTQTQRDAAETYLAKLRHQHDPSEMLRIVQTQRENKKLLMWTVRRLLWLKTDKTIIREALELNRRESSRGHDLAHEICSYLFPPRGEALSPLVFCDGDPLMLDKSETAVLCEQQRGGPPDLGRMTRYSLGAVLTSGSPSTDADPASE